MSTSLPERFEPTRTSNSFDRPIFSVSLSYLGFLFNGSWNGFPHIMFESLPSPPAVLIDRSFQRSYTSSDLPFRRKAQGKKRLRWSFDSFFQNVEQDTDAYLAVPTVLGAVSLSPSFQYSHLRELSEEERASYNAWHQYGVDPNELWYWRVLDAVGIDGAPLNFFTKRRFIKSFTEVHPGVFFRYIAKQILHNQQL